ncbi:hypothetical protein KOR34_00530 [Posidoniimonas corsicana]|uniref:Uncharacterized protein n=1 Tax=Posidoniimonas corsicana TaxID=1938618 RepID=A0A5C5VC10_9BACT|nr:hypothetical protein KOR34_00530 [Posidoniimonas corsicana]
MPDSIISYRCLTQLNAFQVRQSGKVTQAIVRDFSITQMKPLKIPEFTNVLQCVVGERRVVKRQSSQLLHVDKMPKAFAANPCAIESKDFQSRQSTQVSETRVRNPFPIHKGELLQVGETLDRF